MDGYAVIEDGRWNEKTYPKITKLLLKRSGLREGS